jgi:proteic killer suppression protein
MAIQSFSCCDTQALFEGGNPRPFRAIKDVATRKLQQLDSAMTLEFLRSPPGNRLEVLRGRRSGQYSIRVNDQFRVCFQWTDAGPTNVEIIDYH